MINGLYEGIASNQAFEHYISFEHYIWLYKEPKVSVLQVNAKQVQKGECSKDFEPEVIGSILTGGNIFHWFFCFHVVNPLMPILALLPIGNQYYIWPIRSSLSHPFTA